MEIIMDSKVTMFADLDCAQVGSYIKVKGKIKKVIGYAIGEDGRDCYVTGHGQDCYGWQTYLVPFEDVKSVWYERSLRE